MSTHADPRAEVTLGILAGGAGHRLQGQDKGLLTAGGRRLVDHVRDRLGAGVGGILISANRDLEAYAALGAPVYPDEVGDEAWPGPVAGLITLLRHCPTPWLQLAPCDAPLLPTDLTARLLPVTGAEDHHAVVPLADGRLQWACSLLPHSSLGAIEASFAAGTRRLGGAIEAVGYRTVDCEADAAAFMNINTPADLADLERRLDRV